MILKITVIFNRMGYIIAPTTYSIFTRNGISAST